MKIKHLALCCLVGGGLLFSGCAGVSTGTAVQTKTTVLKHSNKILKAPDYMLSNGVIVAKNGKRILDEEGDIVGVYNFPNKSIYLLKIPGKNIYKIKTFEKKVLKSFNANNIIPFSEEGKVLFAIRLEKNQTSFYDNIYMYNGKEIELVNKNINLASSYPTGLYALSTIYDSTSDFYYIKYQSLLNMLTGEKIFNKKIPTKYKAKEKPIIIGARGNQVYYTYSVSGGMYYTYFIEAYDMKTHRNYILSAGRVQPEIEFLVAGNKTVLHIIDNNRYIDLDNLEEVQGVDNRFKSVNKPLGIMNFRDMLVDLSNRKEIKPIF